MIQYCRGTFEETSKFWRLSRKRSKDSLPVNSGRTRFGSLSPELTIVGLDGVGWVLAKFSTAEASCWILSVDFMKSTCFWTMSVTARTDGAWPPYLRISTSKVQRLGDSTQHAWRAETRKSEMKFESSKDSSGGTSKLRTGIQVSCTILGPLSMISKISLEDFLSQENHCHWTSERDCKPAQQWIQQHLLPGDMSQIITAKQTSSLKIYCRNTKSSSRCWPRGLDL